MASMSPWRWSHMSTADNHSIFLPSSPPILYRRNLLITFSSSDSSSSSSSSSSFSSDPTKRHANFVNTDPFPGEALPDLGRQEFSRFNCITTGVGDEEIEVSSNRIGSSTRSGNRRSKSFSGRSKLWRRILFASKKVRSIMLLNVITVVYASTIPVVKEVEAIMDPALFTVVRFAVSAIPFIPSVFQALGDVQTRNAGIELGLWVSLGYLMQALGLLTSDAGRASFISSFTIIVVPLLDAMLGATVPARIWSGAFMSILGVALLESSGSPPCVGDLLNFLSAVFFGVHMLRTEHISRRTKKENFLALLGCELCIVALFSTMWFVLGGYFGATKEYNPPSWTGTMQWDWMLTFPWIPALYTGIFSTGLCLWLEMAAMRDVSATETAIIYGLEPFWGAGFSWVLLGERWGTTGWIGASLVIVGSLMVQMLGTSSPSKSREDENGSKKVDHLLSSGKKNEFSKSTVIVRSRRPSLDRLHKP